MKLSKFIRSVLCMGICVCACYGQSALSRYIYASKWTPVLDHATDITPGLIIAVNLNDGSWEPVDLQNDENGIPLETFNASLDPAQSAAYADKAAAQKDLRSLFGPEMQVELPDQGAVEFSGVQLTVSRLDNTRQKQLFNNHSGPTYNTIREWYNGKRVALLLVTQVGSITAIQIKSGHLGASPVARVEPCPDGSSPRHAESNAASSTEAPKSVAEFRTAERSQVASGVVRTSLCHTDDAQHIILHSDHPIPIAMKVKLITSYRNGAVDTDYGEPALPFYDPQALKDQCRKLLAAAY